MATIDIVKQEPNTEKNSQIISINGEIDRDTIVSFREKIDLFLQDFAQDNLIMNLENLEFINSEGIGYLSDVYNRLSGQNKHLFILRASDRIMDIFQLVGLNQIVQCFQSEEECMNAIS